MVTLQEKEGRSWEMGLLPAEVMKGDERGCYKGQTQAERSVGAAGGQKGQQDVGITPSFPGALESLNMLEECLNLQGRCVQVREF